MRVCNLISMMLIGYISIPSELNVFKPKYEKNKLTFSYDKNKTSLKSIIEILNKYKITFNEINTYESDLEDIFIKLTKEKENI